MATRTFPILGVYHTVGLGSSRNFGTRNATFIGLHSAFAVDLDDATVVAGAVAGDGAVPASGVAYAYALHLPPVAYCTTKSTGGGCTPSIRYSGTPTLTGPDDLAFRAREVPANVFGMFFWGTGPNAAIPAFGGTLCVHPPCNAQPSNSPRARVLAIPASRTRSRKPKWPSRPSRPARASMDSSGCATRPRSTVRASRSPTPSKSTCIPDAKPTRPGLEHHRDTARWESEFRDRAHGLRLRARVPETVRPRPRRVSLVCDHPARLVSRQLSRRAQRTPPKNDDLAPSQRSLVM